VLYEVCLSLSTGDIKKSILYVDTLIYMMDQRLRVMLLRASASYQLVVFSRFSSYYTRAVVGEWGVGGGRECTVEGGERAAYIYG
jgi:hypothetical protein